MADSRRLYPVAGLERMPSAFRAELLAVALRRGLDPTALAAVMSLESGFRASAVNPSSGASGLIQFMPQTARMLGTTVETIRGMSAVAQLRLVEAYYARFGRGVRRPEDHYLACFLPKYIGAADSTEIAHRGQPIYDQNTGLDVDRDGVLTVGDSVSRFRQLYESARMRDPLAVASVDLLGTTLVAIGLGAAGYLAWKIFR